MMRGIKSFRPFPITVFLAAALAIGACGPNAKSDLPNASLPKVTTSTIGSSGLVTTTTIPAGGIKQSRPVLVTGSSLPSATSSVGPEDAAYGLQAPELSGESFDGTPVSVTADGKPKVLIFLAHWCPHCEREAPVLTAWINAHKSTYANVDIVAIATAVQASAPDYPPSAWLQKMGWPTPVMADDLKSDAAGAYGLNAYPYFVALDSSLEVVDRQSGELSGSDFDGVVEQAQHGATASPDSSGGRSSSSSTSPKLGT